MVDEMKVELNLLYLEKVDYAILPWQQLSSAQLSSGSTLTHTCPEQDIVA